jgi:hypothetical protein
MGNGNSRKSSDPDATGAGGADAPENAAPELTDIPKQSGRVQFDERGNAVWEWAIKTGKFGRETTTERLRRLESSGLSLADDAPTPFDKVKPNPLGTVKGYDPYDSGKLARSESQKKRKTDLRKLSDWLKLKKQAAKNNPDEEEE